jgi:sulfatase modifying factor 1
MRFARVVPVVLLGACVQPQDPKLPQPPDDGAKQCPLFERDPMKEPDLMAWDATQRQKVHEKRSRGVVAVHMGQSGCDVTARVVDCVGTVEGTAKEPYDFKWYYSRDTVTADTQREAYTKLPLGAASLGAEIGAGKSLRVDYVMAGSYVLPDALSISGWVGSECGEATHFVTRVVVGGFARASGQREKVHADVGLFGMGAGAGEQSSQLHWRTEGSPTACREAEQKRDVSAGCDMPLRLELKPIPGREPVAAPAAPEREEPVAQMDPVRTPPRPDPVPTRTATPPAPPPPPSAGCPSGMAAIPRGTFQMGSNSGDADEKPVHAVTVGAFCMDVTEVTVDAYASCVRGGGCNTSGLQGSGEWWAKACNWGQSGKGRHPINCVDWNQASAYCQWASKRLPTEEEWEYGALGTSGRTYPWGNEAPGPRLLNACGSECVAWASAQGQTWKGMYSTDDGWATTAPVGSFPSGDSPFGLKDMAGNVWEWTSSGYSEDYSKNRATDKRVNRGGSWSRNDPSIVRAAHRFSHVPTLRYDYLGFRCAR